MLMHSVFRFPFVAAMAGLLFAGASCVAAAPLGAVTSLSIGGDVLHPMSLAESELAAMPHVSVKASAHGVSGEWSGVALSTILAAAGAPQGKALRGKNLSLYVRIRASDGYQVVYALAELDPQFHRDPVILADRHDGKALDAQHGSFQVVAPDDLRPARWIRQVRSIDLLRAPGE